MQDYTAEVGSAGHPRENEKRAKLIRTSAAPDKARPNQNNPYEPKTQIKIRWLNWRKLKSFFRNHCFVKQIGTILFSGLILRTLIL